MSMYMQTEFAKVETEVRRLHLELAGESAKHLGKPRPVGGLFSVGPIADFRKSVGTSFRHNWNTGIRRGYESIVGIFRSTAAPGPGEAGGSKE